MICHRCTKTPLIITSYNLILHLAQCLHTGMNNMGDSGSPFCRLLELLGKSHKLPLHNGRYATLDPISSSNTETHLQHYKIQTLLVYMIISNLLLKAPGTPCFLFESIASFPNPSCVQYLSTFHKYFPKQTRSPLRSPLVYWKAPRNNLLQYSGKHLEIILQMLLTKLIGLQSLMLVAPSFFGMMTMHDAPRLFCPSNSPPYETPPWSPSPHLLLCGAHVWKNAKVKPWSLSFILLI